MTANHPFLPLIAETLQVTAPSRVTAIGDLPWPDGAMAPERLSVAAALETAAARTRTELAIVRLTPAQDKNEARQLIAALRDLLARQLLLFVPENLLEDSALIGLALQRQARFELEGEHWQAWSYDIRTYKAVPDWLNPKFWANPDNWDKYRW